MSCHKWSNIVITVAVRGYLWYNSGLFVHYPAGRCPSNKVYLQHRRQEQAHSGDEQYSYFPMTNNLPQPLWRLLLLLCAGSLREALASWRRCVSTTFTTTLEFSWSSAKATSTWDTCRNTLISSTGRGCRFPWNG